MRSPCAATTEVLRRLAIVAVALDAASCGAAPSIGLHTDAGAYEHSQVEGSAPDLSRDAPGSPPLPPVTAGGPCNTNTDCRVPEVCLDDLSTHASRGFCSLTCLSNSDCPVGTICVNTAGGTASAGACYATCAATADCPDGRICFGQPANGGPPYFCWPYCQADADCPLTGHCDLWLGACEAPNPAKEALDPIGARCRATSINCRGGVCLGVTLQTEGICSAFCSLSKNGCPPGAECVAASNRGPDVGYCLASCLVATECAPGLVCALADPTSAARDRRGCYLP